MVSTTPRQAPPRRGRRVAGPVLLAVLGLVLAAAGLGAAPAQAAPSRLTATATTDLQDGSGITLTATGRDPQSSLEVYQCKGGEYAEGASMVATVLVDGGPFSRRDADCGTDVANTKVDNSGRFVSGVAEADGTMTMVMNVDAGTFPKHDTDQKGKLHDWSFACGADAPCALVVVDPISYRVVQSWPLTFAPDVSTACGAATPTTLSGGGPFSMAPTYQAWAAGSCATGTDAPLLAGYVQTGEHAGLADFQQGLDDYAISATGFTTPGGDDVTGTRGAVLTPVAVQAAVLAYDGGYTVSNSDGSSQGNVPLPELEMTLAEAASLFDTARQATAAADAALVQRNPLLAKVGVGVGANLVAPDGALQSPDAATLAMTTAWAALPTAAGGTKPWTHGPVRAFPVSVASGTGVATVPLFSTLPGLRTQVLGSAWTGPGAPADKVLLYLTDSATAAELGLRTVSLQNEAGAFVAPTAESVAAGVAHMVTNADGTRSPGPTADDAAAYPLPLVEYAVTPTAPYADPAKRDRAVAFLTHATGAGQRQLGRGLFPLPADLTAQAAASLPLIGAKVAAPAGGGGGGGSTTSAAAGGGSGRTSGPTAGTGRAGGGATTPPGTAGTGGGAGTPTGTAGEPVADEPTAEQAEDPVAVPAFRPAASTTMGRLGPPAGVVGLALLLCGAAYATSGWPLPVVSLAGLALRGRARGLAGRVRGLLHRG